jgi:flagellar hook assembly protein FlgD
VVTRAGEATLKILDLAGDVVWQFTDSDVQPGDNHIKWTGNNVAEHFAGAGIYVYVFTFTPENGSETKVIRKPIGILR